MKIFKTIGMVLIAMSLPANAEVFKCKSAKGEIIYQRSACTPETTQGLLNIKEMTPQEMEEAKANLKAEQEEEAANDRANVEAEKQRQSEQERQEKLDLERRGIEAREREAIAAQQRSGGPGRGFIYPPPYGSGGHY
ncbi:MAG: hypothetical protein ABL933_10440 [Methyloglobulus sp.]|nr:hypothetical protein [Methyloglobulus sp.]